MDIDKDKIYKIITDLEGPKHPIDNMQALNHAKDYIVGYLLELGVDVEIQSFKIKGFDEEFHNIIGVIGDPSKPAILLGSHYDTVRFCPGANDNLSALAVSLEVGRELMKLKEPPSVIIASFTLEEGHPGVLKYRQESLKEAGLISDNLKYVSLALKDASKSLHKKVLELKKQDYKANEVYKILLGKDLSKEERAIASVLDKVFDEYNPDTLEEEISLVGSNEFVKKIKRDNIQVKSIINYDCLGWIKKEHGTQKKLPITPDMAPFINEYSIDRDNMIGNYLGIAGDINSIGHVEEFASCCEDLKIDIPHIAMKFPIGHAQLKKIAPDILRSDHSPFWKVGIPGIFISDFANFRSDLYHTPADESDHIDYDVLKKVAEATVLYLLK